MSRLMASHCGAETTVVAALSMFLGRLTVICTIAEVTARPALSMKLGRMHGSRVKRVKEAVKTLGKVIRHRRDAR